MLLNLEVLVDVIQFTPCGAIGIIVLISSMVALRIPAHILGGTAMIPSMTADATLVTINIAESVHRMITPATIPVAMISNVPRIPSASPTGTAMIPSLTANAISVSGKLVTGVSARILAPIFTDVPGIPTASPTGSAMIPSMTANAILDTLKLVNGVCAILLTTRPLAALTTRPLSKRVVAIPTPLDRDREKKQPTKEPWIYWHHPVCFFQCLKRKVKKPASTSVTTLFQKWSTLNTVLQDEIQSAAEEAGWES